MTRGRGTEGMAGFFRGRAGRQTLLAKGALSRYRACAVCAQLAMARNRTDCAYRGWPGQQLSTRILPIEKMHRGEGEACLLCFATREDPAVGVGRDASASD
jgi:hypothetical protein